MGGAVRGGAARGHWVVLVLGREAVCEMAEAGRETKSTSLTRVHVEVLRTIVLRCPNRFIFELTFGLSTAVGVLYSKSVVYRYIVDYSYIFLDSSYVPRRGSGTRWRG